MPAPQVLLTRFRELSDVHLLAPLWSEAATPAQRAAVVAKMRALLRPPDDVKAEELLLRIAADATDAAAATPRADAVSPAA